MALLVRLRYTCRPTDRASKFLAVIVYSLALFCSCGGSLTVKPINVEAVIGQRVQLNCSTSQPYYVLWDHASVGSTSRSYIFFSGVLVLPYSQRFQLDRDNATGAYNLVIPSVQKEDAGNYRCMDMAGHGEQAEAELIVLDSNPQCETSVLHFCDRTSQDFETSCAVGFRGNLVPEMECSSNGVMTSNSVVNGQIGDSVTYNLRLTAHWPLDDGHPIVCHTSLSHVSSSVNLTVMYAFGSNQTLAMDHRETVDCKANSSEQCSYQWIHKDTGVVISGNQTLTADEAGQYTCEATCKLRDEICSVIPLVANLTAHEADTDRSHVPIAICVAVVITGLIVAALVMVRRHRRMKSHRNISRPTDEEASSQFLNETLTTNGTSPRQETSLDREWTNGNVNTHNILENSHKNVNGHVHCTPENSHKNVNGNVHCTPENSHRNVNGNVHCTPENSHRNVNGNVHCTPENSHRNVNSHVHCTPENSHKNVNVNVHCTPENSHKNVNGNVHCTPENSHKNVNGNVHCTPENSHRNVNGNAHAI